MLSIMVCHLFQAYHNVWADVFNMGVQVFLCFCFFLGLPLLYWIFVREFKWEMEIVLSRNMFSCVDFFTVFMC